MLEAFRNNDDPGIFPLRADRLALAMRDAQIARRPRSRIRYINAGIGWLMIGLFVWFALIAAG
jgi:hypothetical protein